ncbi:Disease resistance protein SUMM2 [Citrus sinensis]|nr:Disease resistance protein SUMM2 [Citrus sinensis]
MAEAAIVQAVGSVLTPAVECGPGIFCYLKRNCGYVKHLKRNFVELEKRKEVKGEFENLCNKYQQTGGCLCGKRPIHSQLKLGKQIEKMIGKIRSLRTEIGQIIKMVPKLPDPFISRHAGVGKTTIMENLHHSIGESRRFDIIFWENINTDGNIRDIQEIILERLKVNAKELNNDLRADIISKELNDRSYVLFLDGVSSEINFKEIGMHDDHGRGKVVFACRSREFCWQADGVIHVQQLCQREAKKLFWEVVGVHLKKYPDIELVADSIVKECGGMPYMLKLIGKELANQSEVAIWRATADELRLTSSEEKKELEEVDRFFTLVYKNLSLEQQHCLLGWAIFSTGLELSQDYIIDGWAAQKFLASFNKIGDAHMPNCCEILTLILEGKRLEKLPTSFFDYMCHLQLLDLHETNIGCLPPSISRLINLNALFLRSSCSLLLQLPAEIGRLQKLEILDVSHTKVQCLPSEIGQLIELKYLRVSRVENVGNHTHADAGSGEMISLNIISKLRLLEELIIEVLNPSDRRWKQNVEKYCWGNCCPGTTDDSPLLLSHNQVLRDF